jgi:hypothetical protein
MITASTGGAVLGATTRGLTVVVGAIVVVVVVVVAIVVVVVVVVRTVIPNDSPDTSTGAPRFVDVPSPIWTNPLPPQHFMPPASSRAHD